MWTPHLHSDISVCMCKTLHLKYIQETVPKKCVPCNHFPVYSLKEWQGRQRCGF